MSLELRKEMKFEPDVPYSPYLAARQEWDNRMGTYVLQSRNWRIASFILLFIVLALVSLVFYLSGQSKHIPYIVELESGEVSKISKLTDSRYTPSDTHMRYHLGAFIEKIRSLSIDHQVNKKWAIEAYGYLSPSVATKMNEYFSSQQNDRAKYFNEDKTVDIKLISFSRVTGSTYQLQWFEEVFDAAGHSLFKERMVGFVTTEISAPIDEKSIILNPLGIWITDFTWSKYKGDI